MFNLEPVLKEAQDRLISVALIDHHTDTSFSLNANEPLHPASTFKVHVMMEVFRQVNAGSLNLGDRISITNSFTSIADGSQYSLDVKDDSEQSLYERLAETETIAELTRLMIVRSSNLATNILIEKIGTKNINDLIHTLGIEGITVRRGVEDNVAFRAGMNNSATARGLTQTMDLIARKKVISEEVSQQMIDILLQQEFNESIPALLPKSVKVAHKTGWTNDFYHDTAIVYPADRKPYILSIMTKGFAEDQETEAHKCMSEISKAIYEQLP
jgi:beta-lactamase class A